VRRRGARDSMPEEIPVAPLLPAHHHARSGTSAAHSRRVMPDARDRTGPGLDRLEVPGAEDADYGCPVAEFPFELRANASSMGCSAAISPRYGGAGLGGGRERLVPAHCAAGSAATAPAPQSAAQQAAGFQDEALALARGDAEARGPPRGRTPRCWTRSRAFCARWYHATWTWPRCATAPGPSGWP
jgi:hypothetical protein